MNRSVCRNWKAPAIGDNSIPIREGRSLLLVPRTHRIEHGCTLGYGYAGGIDKYDCFPVLRGCVIQAVRVVKVQGVRVVESCAWWWLGTTPITDAQPDG